MLHPDVLRRIYTLGLSKNQLCEIMMIISELSLDTSVTAGALRMRRYRASLGNVTCDVTCDAHIPPLEVSSEVPPKSIIKPLPTSFLLPPIDLAKAKSCPNPSFDLFWKAYPRREAKQSARKKFEMAVKSGIETEKIISAATRYDSFCRQEKTEKQYIKSPDTWLSKGCWDDELPNGQTAPLPIDTRTVEQIKDDWRKNQEARQNDNQ